MHSKGSFLQVRTAFIGTYSTQGSNHSARTASSETGPSPRVILCAIYLMTGLYSQAGQSKFVCIDRDQKLCPSLAGDETGALLYHVQVTCT